MSLDRLAVKSLILLVFYVFVCGAQPTFAQEQSPEHSESVAAESETPGIAESDVTGDSDDGASAATPSLKSRVNFADVSQEAPSLESAGPEASQKTVQALEVYDAALDIWHKVGGDILVGLMEVTVTGEALDPMLAESLSAVIAAELATISRSRYRVISRNELQNMLIQKVEAQQLGCVEAACLSDIGKLAAADFIITSSVGQVGKEWVFTLELIDVRVGNVLRRQAVTWQGSPAGLVQVCRPMVVRLIDGTAAADYSGGLQVLSNEVGATVHIDDVEAGRTPIDLYPNLAIGRHRVNIKKDGFIHYSKDVVVHRNETTLLQAELVDEDRLKPWYQKWWVWTGTAALVAGGIAAAAMLQNSETTIQID